MTKTRIIIIIMANSSKKIKCLLRVPGSLPLSDPLTSAPSFRLPELREAGLSTAGTSKKENKEQVYGFTRIIKIKPVDL